MPVASVFDDAINRLKDLAHAGQQRCALAATLVHRPALQSELLLLADQHRRDAEQLNEIVVQLRGTPHSDLGDALVAEPLLQAPALVAGDEAAVLQVCMAAEAAAAQRADEVLNLPALPPPIVAAVTRYLDAAHARQRKLLRWGTQRV